MPQAVNQASPRPKRLLNASLLLLAGCLGLTGQERLYYQSSLDGKLYELRQVDESTIVLYAADGSIAASLARKKASDKFKGETGQMAPQCPAGRGKIEVLEMTTNRIRVRAEKPTSAEINGRHPCLMPMMNSWNTFDLIKGAGPVQPAATVATAPTPPVQSTPPNPVQRNEEKAQQSNQSNPPLPNPVKARPPQRKGFDGTLYTVQSNDKSEQSDTVSVVAQTVDSPARPSSAMELVYNTFLPLESGQRFDQAAMDSAGNAYVGFVCKGIPGVIKIDSSGQKILFRTAIAMPTVPSGFCEDPRFDQFARGVPVAKIQALTIGKDGSIYLAGTVEAPYYFATVRAPRPSPPTDQSVKFNMEGFLVKLSPNGKSVEYSTLWGGASHDWITSIAVEDDGGVWAVGATYSNDFPRVGSFADFDDCSKARNQYGLCQNGFVAYFDSTGKPRLSSTLGAGWANDVVLTQAGAVVVGKLRLDDRVNEQLRKSFVLPAQDCGAIWTISRESRTLSSVSCPGGGEENLAPVFGELITASADPAGGLVLNGPSYGRTAEGNYNAVVRASPNLKEFRQLQIGRETQIWKARVTPDGTVFAGGFSNDYVSHKTWLQLRKGDDGPQSFLTKFDPDGVAVWSSSLGGYKADETRFMGQLPSPFADAFWNQRGAWSVATNDSEVIVLSRTAAAWAPMTPDALIDSAPRRKGYGDEAGGFTLTKYRLASDSSLAACRSWAQPATIYVTNQGGQDFHPFIAVNRANCKWSIQSSDNWIKATPMGSTEGTGVLKVDIESNYDPRRSGKITLLDETGRPFELRVVQSAVPQQVSLSRTVIELNSKGASTVPVDAKCIAQDCEWSISATSAWLKVDGPATRSGPGTITVRTLPNTSGSVRSAQLAIGSARLTVIQGTEDIPGESSGDPGKPIMTPKPQVIKPKGPVK